MDHDAANRCLTRGDSSSVPLTSVMVSVDGISRPVPSCPPHSPVPARQPVTHRADVCVCVCARVRVRVDMCCMRGPRFSPGAKRHAMRGPRFSPGAKRHAGAARAPKGTRVRAVWVEAEGRQNPVVVEGGAVAAGAGVADYGVVVSVPGKVRDASR